MKQTCTIVCTIICTFCILAFLSGCYYIALDITVDRNGSIGVEDMTVTGGPKDYKGDATVDVVPAP